MIKTLRARASAVRIQPRGLCVVSLQDFTIAGHANFLFGMIRDENARL